MEQDGRSLVALPGDGESAAAPRRVYVGEKEAGPRRQHRGTERRGSWLVGLGLGRAAASVWKNRREGTGDTVRVRDRGLGLYRDPGLVGGTGTREVCERGRGKSAVGAETPCLGGERLEPAVWGGGWGLTVHWGEVWTRAFSGSRLPAKVGVRSCPPGPVQTRASLPWRTDLMAPPREGHRWAIGRAGDGQESEGKPRGGDGG